jgi:PAS domain S-box-containing protein
MKKISILLIDDNPDDRTLTKHVLKKEFNIEVYEIKDEKEFNSALKKYEFDMVITDYQLRWSTGLEIIHVIKALDPACPVIMFTGTGNEEIAVEAMKNGLDDYIVKSPKHFVRIPAAVGLALNRLKEQQERKWAERALYESEEKFRNIFEASPNAITVSDLDGNIIECNQAMLELHGFGSKKEAIGRNAFTLIAKKDQERAIRNMEKILEDGIVKNIEYTFSTKNGSEFPAELSAGVIMDLAGKPVSYVTLTKDISEQKQAEEEIKKRMMKFRLDEGKFYLVKESSPVLSLEAFKDLLKVGYHGLVVSRTPENDFKKIINNFDFDFIWLAEKSVINSMQPKLKEIELKIETLPRKYSVLIDRMDYLIFKNGYKKTLSFVQNLRDLAYLTSNIIIMSIDPTTLRNQELRLLEKESAEIEPRIDKRKIPEELFKILQFIYKENGMGIKPSYINIGQELKISRPTVRKRVRNIISAGYVFENVKGKNKILELTEMGRNLFYK